MTGKLRQTLLAALASTVFLAACPCRDCDSSATGAEMDEVARSYVGLVLALGQHDADYVDAYYGPDELRTDEEIGISQIRRRALELIERLGDGANDAGDELTGLRHSYLVRQLDSLVARTEMLEGARLTFDEESQALYDAVAPDLPDSHFQQTLDELETMLPGDGPLVDRWDEFRKQFVIPTERLDQVFRVAIDACRERTAHHIEIPAGESFDFEFVTDKPWSGYNWYKGDYHSLIQVNTDLPIYIDRALDLACHEGYPGHHLYNALLEKHLVNERGWVEFTVYPLFSPQSLIAEGTANYGTQVTFSTEDRLSFERATLFPLAGLDPDTAEQYARVLSRVEQLNYASNEAARSYLDGEIDARGAAEWLTRYAMMPAAKAEKRVEFIDKYRSYVINYNLGQDLVREYVERAAGSRDEDRLWEVFGQLLASPRLPSGLREPS